MNHYFIQSNSHEVCPNNPTHISLFSLIPFEIDAQHLDVEGDAKIRGNIDIYHPNDSTSLYIGRKASTGTGTSGKYNVFLGSYSGLSNAGQSNTFIGQNSGQDEAGFNASSGNNNSFFGFEAGFNNRSGSDNAFFSHQAGKENTTGLENAFFGYLAGRDNIDGEDNTFFGFGAGISNSGSNNAFIGRSAGRSNNQGKNNTFLGASSGSMNGTGNFNTFLGNDSGFGNKEGSRNSFVSASSGLFLGDSMDRAIAIGFNAKVGCSNCAVIGGSGLDSVRVGIGITNPSQVLDVNGNARFRDVTALLPLNNVAPLYLERDGTLKRRNFSDRRLKENIRPLSEILENIDRLNITILSNRILNTSRRLVSSPRKWKNYFRNWFLQIRNLE